MLIATLIATEQLEMGELSSVKDWLVEAGCEISEVTEIIDGRTADIFFEGDLETARSSVSDIRDSIDIVVQDSENREKKLLISDMDSTMITVECIDELADYAGLKEQVAEITERAMQGELDFEQALRGRVKLLAGLETVSIDRCLNDRVKIMSGAKTLVKTMEARGAKTILVSGGFTRFAEPVGAEIGFELVEANILGEENDRLTGELDGAIVDGTRKAEILKEVAAKADLSLLDCIAVGDGANDIPMIRQAGMGIAYHAKLKAENASDAAIRHNDLTALLYLQGIPRNEWVTY